MNDITDVCVYGIGGIGGLLCNSTNVHKAKISFIARGRNLDAIKRNGVKLRLPNKTELVCRPDYVSSKFCRTPRPQVLFIAVKSCDLPIVLSEIADIVDQSTFIIPLMNGFDIYEKIRHIVKNATIFPSCVIFGGRRTDYGKSELYLPGTVFFGPHPTNRQSIPDNLLSFLEVLDKSPVTFNRVDDPYPIIWQKYMGNVALSLVGAYSGKVLGDILVNPELRQLLIDILNETAKVIEKKKIPFPPNATEKVLGVIQKMPSETRSSFAIDIERRSPGNEGDIFGTAIIDLAQQLGVPAPKTGMTFAEIQKKTEQHSEAH